MPLSEKVGEQRLRILCLSLLVMTLLLLLAGRLFYLQIMHGHKYAEQALKNMVRPERIPAQRGRIYDREGRLLAGSRVGFNLNLEAGHPAYHDRRRLREAAEEAAAILGRDPNVLEQRALRYRRMFEPLLIARDMQISAMAPFFERLHPIPGITRRSIPVRWYPCGDLAAHVLGHVGVIEEEELEEAGDLRFRRGVFLGRSGIEFQYEALLHGTDGETFVEVDAVGRTTDLFSGLPPMPAKPGSDLYLTLDARLQRVAEEALRIAHPHGIESSAPVRGSLVALDPWTGEVLVCASSPGFDPNDFAHGLTPAQWEALNDETHPLLNRVVQAGYPPGSTFKVVTVLAGLDEGIVSGEMAFVPCLGEYRFGRRVFGCWKDNGHGRLDLRGAFEQSCDVYFYQVARAMGLERLLRFAGSLNLDALTGIDLPEEREGLIPTMDWYRRKLGTEPPEGNALNISIGQGEIVLSPIQLASLFAAIVSDGAVRRPHVTLRAVGNDGSLIWDHTGQQDVIGDLGVPDSHLVVLRDLLEEAVEGRHGTGWRARIPGVRVGGKTGTAQNPHGEDHALFVGVAPMEDPRIVAVAVIEESGHGGSVAAPVVHAVLKAFLLGGQEILSEEAVRQPPSSATRSHTRNRAERIHG